MSNGDDLGPAPAPMGPAVAAAPAPAVEPWQARLELVALLLLLTVAVTTLARLVGAYDQEHGFQMATGGPVDLIAVVRFAGVQTGPIASGALLIAFLLVTLGPGDRISSRGVLALWSATVLGLFLAGLGAFSSVAVIAQSADSAARSLGAGSGSFVGRLTTSAPVLLAAVIAGYVAWCAFSTLGETPELLFPDEVESDAVVDAEEA